jgi:hypothetical protein
VPGGRLEAGATEDHEAADGLKASSTERQPRYLIFFPR